MPKEKIVHSHRVTQRDYSDIVPSIIGIDNDVHAKCTMRMMTIKPDK